MKINREGVTLTHMVLFLLLINIYVDFNFYLINLHSLMMTQEARFAKDIE